MFKYLTLLVHLFFTTLLFSSLLFSEIVLAKNIEVQINSELPDEITKNVLAHLGDLPENELQRNAFLYTSKDNINNALQALGYYHATIVTRIDKVNKATNKSKLIDIGHFILNDKNTSSNVGSDDNKRPWVLHIKIELNQPTLVNSVELTILGDAINDPEISQYLQNLPIKKGDVLHHGHYENLKSEIVFLGINRGYLDGSLKENQIAINTRSDSADIKITYVSGPRYRFGDVNFSDFDIEKDILEALIPFEYGDYYSTPKFHQLQQQIQATRYFGSVIAEPDKKNAVTQNHDAALGAKSDDNKFIPINVELLKAKSHQFDVGVGYATDTEFRISTTWRTPLINRYGHFQESKIEYSQINPTGRFLYSIPLSHPIDDLLQFKVTLENATYADIDSKFYSLQVGRVRKVDQWLRQIYLRNLNEKWQYGIPDEKLDPTLSELEEAEYIIPGISWSQSKTKGSPIDPSSGFMQVYNFEGGNSKFSSESSFIRAQARWKFITTLGENHKLVTRAEVGAAFTENETALAPSLRFYAGGDQSVRGFAYQSIGETVSTSDKENLVVGGTRLVVGSVEYQYYVTNKWRVALFTDAGSASFENNLNFKYSVGTGLHYISPVGAVKIDLGYSISEENPGWRLHFSLGAGL